MLKPYNNGASARQARLRRVALLVPVVLLLSGCSTVTSQSFKPSSNAVVEAAYIATDADFGRYSRLLGEDMGIFSPQNRPLSDED